MPAAPAPRRFAILDMYAGAPNQGLRCLEDMLRGGGPGAAGGGEVTVFATRGRGEVPGLDFDAYFATGGPGSPFEGEGTAWEAAYFEFLDRLLDANRRPGGAPRHLLAICYSFELLCRHFRLAEVTRRRSPSFGVMPVHLTPAGRTDPLFAGLPDPFYAVDNRDWQVVQPSSRALDALGGRVLALEKVRPHVALERAVTAMRLSPEVVGVQFHPEAEPESLLAYFRRPELRRDIVLHHGEAKYADVLAKVADPGLLARTYRTVIPNFLRAALAGRG